MARAVALAAVLVVSTAGAASALPIVAYNVTYVMNNVELTGTSTGTAALTPVGNYTITGSFALASDSTNGYLNGISGATNSLLWANLSVVTAGTTYNFYYNVPGQTSSALAVQSGTELTTFFRLTSGSYAVQLDWLAASISQDSISSFVQGQSYTSTAVGNDYLLTGSGSAVPEPASMTALAAGIAGLTALRRRKAARRNPG